MPSLAECIYEEGFQFGFQQGIEQGRAEGIEEGRAKGIEQVKAEGIKQGIEQIRFTVAKKMLAEGLELSLIAKITSLSPALLKQLKKQ